MASGIGPAVEASLVSTHSRARAPASLPAPPQTVGVPPGRQRPRRPRRPSSGVATPQQRPHGVCLCTVSPLGHLARVFLQVGNPGMSRCRGFWRPRDTRVVMHASDPQQRRGAVRRPWRPAPGWTCWQTGSGMVALACPRRSETTSTGTPSASSRVAGVWQRSCSRITSSRFPSVPPRSCARPAGLGVAADHAGAHRRRPAGSGPDRLPRAGTSARSVDSRAPCPASSVDPLRHRRTALRDPCQSEGNSRARR